MPKITTFVYVPWTRRLQAVAVGVGDAVHTGAVYVGIAVLTTLALSFVLPSMREQSQQLQQAMLATFESDVGATTMDDAPVSDWSLPSVLPPVDLGAAPVEHGTSRRAAVANTLSFARALQASEHDAPIRGVTDEQARALRSYLSRKYKIAHSVAGALVRTAFAVARERSLDPQLVLAVIAIESRYNPFAESAVGAQGLMQVMTRVHQDKLESSGGALSIFNPVVNIRVGTQILADCIKRRGSVKGGLACYVGATGPSDGGYGSRVLAERRRIALASGITPDKS